jgi:pimeloyl-ACP methyl ester carboxylesterase
MANTNWGNNLSINGFDLYYEIHGKGFPLLLLHGFTGSGAGLVQGFNQLGTDYQLIIPDLRGHGRSTNPSKQFTFKQAALDIFALLDHLHVSECNAVGFSGGGCTLLQMAYNCPEKIKSMTIVSAAPYFPQETRDIMKQFSMQHKTEEEWTAMRNLHFHGDEQIQMLWDQASAFSSDDMNFTPEMLSKITSKTLVVQGDRDPLYPIELTIEMYKSIPDAYLWIVPNGGHVPVSADSTQEFINYLRKLFVTTRS